MNVANLWDWNDCPIGQLFYWIKYLVQKIKEDSKFYAIFLIVSGLILFIFLWYFAYILCRY